MSKTILCADDSATMQKVAEITFAASDYKYVGARTVDEALQLAQSENPALILADAVMAGKNGYDLCRAVKSDSQLAAIPVLVMCGNSQSYDGARGEPAGADGFVTKPWDTQVMLDKVAETLARVASEGAAPLGQGAAGGAATGNTRPNRAPTSQPVSTAPFPAQSRAPSAPLRAPSSGPTSPRASSQATAVSSAPGAQLGMPQPPRSATIMGMPTFPMPPATEGAAVAAPVAPAPTPAPQVRATGSASDASANLRPPMIKGTPQRRLRLVPISEMAAQVASEHGLDPEGPEMQALLKLSREVVERIVWEVVPDLAEAIIKQNLDRLTARAR